MTTTEPATAPAAQDGHSAAERAGLPEDIGEHLPDAGPVVVLPTTLSADVATREALALALSVVLLGLLVMSTRRNALLQVVGFLSLENGLILAAVGAAGMPLVVELSTAVLVLVAFGVFGAFVLRIRDRFTSLDTVQLDGVGRSHR